jgi:hypothetical protein
VPRSRAIINQPTPSFYPADPHLFRSLGPGPMTRRRMVR